MNSFRRVLAAEVVSNFGSMLTRLVVPWIAALTLDATPFEMGLLLVADVAAGAAASLALGVLVDRLPKRRVMILADLARAALIGAVALAVWRGWITLALLVLVQTLSGLLNVAFELARSAWIARREDSARLATRNAQLSAAGSITESASFGIGGWLYQALGGALSLATDALSYLVSALCLGGVHEPSRAHAASARLRWSEIAAEARNGVVLVVSDATLCALAVLEVLVALGGSLAGTSYMIYVARDLGFETGVLGMIFAVGGGGAALGAAVAPALGRRLGSRAAIAWGLALLALGAAFIPLAAGATVVAGVLLVAHQLIGDAGHVMYSIHDRTLRQSIAPATALARVDAGLRTLGQITTVCGALGGGLIATALGARTALVLAAVISGGAALYASIAFARAGAVASED